MSFWKACDIRGLFPTDINPGTFEDIGRFIRVLLPKNGRVTTAGDFRVSTPDLKAALVRGLVEAGVSVLDAGQLPTPIAYFAHHHWGTDAVLVVTASHNPAEYNGLKLMLGFSPPSEEDLRRLRRAVEEKRFTTPLRAGSVEPRDPVPLYNSWMKQRWQHLRLNKTLRLVLDAGNGAWSSLAPPIFENLGFSVHPLFCEADGHFPNRAPDSARAANLTRLRSEIKTLQADVGIAWDGDGDRVAFLDNRGTFVSADEISMMMARKLLTGRPGEKVAYDIKLSDMFRKIVLELSGIPLVERSGHTFLKRRVIDDHCLFGCEVSGHYFFRELRGGDDGVFAALHVLELLQNGKRFDELRQELPRLHVTPDLRLTISGDLYDSIIERLRKRLKPSAELAIDGLRMETADGFILVRRSVTEPAITIRIEGHTDDSLRDLIDTCSSALSEFSETIRTQIQEETHGKSDG